MSLHPPRVFLYFKIQVRDLLRQQEKILGPKLIQRLKEIGESIEETGKNPDLLEVEKEQELAVLDAEKRTLEGRLRDSEDTSSKAWWFTNAERLCKSWCCMGKESKPRNIIYSLKKQTHHNQNDPINERNSHKMANLATSFHSKLQETEQDEDVIARRRAITSSLESIRGKVQEVGQRNLGNLIEDSEIADAIRNAKLGTAPGPDGITPVFWKFLLSSSEEAKKQDNSDVFNPSPLLGIVFRDIQNFGVIEDSTFTDAWMCPIYKKGDVTEIGNYRPISVANTDYKLLTTTLTKRLGEVAKHLIHTDQAGFVKGRQITDHTRFIQSLIQYADIASKNGAIVALDQEKAYDRICNDYLWEVLATFRIPHRFIRTIQSLYACARTTVMINGCLSEPFQVTRGVRQGDPLSCLLFDLAIEPLANMIRNSPLIQGFALPGQTDPAKTLLFADDTTVFLAESDNFKDLTEILQLWCRASGANFNVNKTQIIPIGTKRYRRFLRSSRHLSQSQFETIPREIKIAPDGFPVRILGAWVGNQTNEMAIWQPTVDKIVSTLTRWEKRNPSIEGQRHIIQMTAGGMSQYLTATQCMPKQIEKILSQHVRTFFWKGRKASPVNQYTTQASLDAGGLKVLDIQLRNEAIDIMWLKRYLATVPHRAKWASLTDAILWELSGNPEREIPIKIVTTPSFNSGL